MFLLESKNTFYFKPKPDTNAGDLLNTLMRVKGNNWSNDQEKNELEKVGHFFSSRLHLVSYKTY